MNTAPLQKNTNQTDKAKALSAEAQAKLNSAEWLKNYKQMMEQAGPEVSGINMRDQIAVAMRDPVYGQATAAGLAAGQNILNSWIAGANSKSRANREKLENERWIKQMQDADEDRALRRQELEESKKQIVQAPGYSLDAFKEKSVRSDPSLVAALDRLNTTHIAKNPEEAAKIQNQLRLDRQMLDASQEAVPMELTAANPNAIDTEKTRGFINMSRRFLNAIPWYGRLALTGDERARANMQVGMENAGFKTFSSVSPESLLKEAQKNIKAGNTNTGVQQRKIAQLLKELLKKPGFIAKQSPDGSTIVVSGPDQKAITLTPNTVDRYIKEYDLSWE